MILELSRCRQDTLELDALIPDAMKLRMGTMNTSEAIQARYFVDYVHSLSDCDFRFALTCRCDFFIVR